MCFNRILCTQLANMLNKTPHLLSGKVRRVSKKNPVCFDTYPNNNWNFNYVYSQVMQMLQYWYKAGIKRHRPATLLVRRKLLLIGCWVCLSDWASLAAAQTQTLSFLHEGGFTYRPGGSDGGVVQFNRHGCRSLHSLFVCLLAASSLSSLASSWALQPEGNPGDAYFQNKRQTSSIST